MLTGPLTRVVTALVGAEPDDLDDPRSAPPSAPTRTTPLFDTARDNLRLGRTVVLVAPFTSILTSHRGLVPLQRLGDVDLRVVWARCPPEELLRRLEARGAARDRSKLVDPSPLLERAARAPLVAHQAVDTTGALADQVRTALAAPITSADPARDPS